MDSTSAALAAVGLLAAVAVVALALFRKRVRVQLEGLGVKLGVDGSNEQVSENKGAVIRRARSRQGRILAEDERGGGAEVTDADAHGDIIASSRTPGTHHPKDARQ
jgi:hypothetical protein